MMRRTIIVFALLLPLAALLLIPAHAQDGPNPTPGPTINDPAVMALPFGETFSTNYGWQASGLWQFVTDTAYEGGGWFVDGAPRQMTSTLESVYPLDLTGSLGIQLIYRQQGNLPSGDLIAVDLSLDGGTTWFLVDQQIGLQAAWETRAVDLSDYRNQVIRLRFRLSTGIAYDPPIAPTETPVDALALTATPGAPTVQGYWIDNLTIQFFFKPPPARPSQLTRLGLHLINGAQREPVLAFVQQLRDAGYPLGSVKGISGTEDLLREIKMVSPETVAIYRTLYTPWGVKDCPDTTAPDPTAEAQRWMYGMLPSWLPVQADYYEITNECHPDPAWMVPFTIEAMRIATQSGVCILVFSFATGMPDVNVYAQYLPVYQYALANPCQPGRTHGIALHAYGVNKQTLLSESGDYLGLRHRLFYQQLLPIWPDAAKIPVYLTEAGPGDGSTMYPCEDIARDVIQYTQQVEADPYIHSFDLWNFGRAAWWADFTPCLPTIADAVLRYYRGG